jgi:hypothetical protein
MPIVLLFLIYINDLPLISKIAHFVLFADDSSVFIPISPNLDNSFMLNSECTKIMHWFYMNRLSINFIKTKCMYFSLRYNNIPPIINVNNTVLHYVTSFKLLGCFISNDLKWNVHIEYVLSKISKGVGLLTCAKHYFPVYVKRMIYFAFINSHLSYCVSIWGNAAQY